MNDKAELVNIAAGIVSAYVQNNSVAQSDLPGLIHKVYAALASASRQKAAGRGEQLKPAVPVKKSVTNDYIICLEDGQNFKSLKRHLRTHHKMSPDEYRAKWGLSKDYPVVAPNYAQTRSALAKQMGLGQKGRTSSNKQ